MENTQIIGTFKQLSLKSQTETLADIQPAICQEFKGNWSRFEDFAVPQKVVYTEKENNTNLTVSIGATTPQSAGSYLIEMRKRRKQKFERTAPYGVKESVKARKSLVF